MNQWDAFFQSKIRKIIDEKDVIIDIGGGLRVTEDKNNRGIANVELSKYIETSKKQYKVLDKVPDYHPDIVGDVHKLPLPDESVDAIICIALLEHVENPLLAMDEMYRVLKPGGYIYIYVPFLYYYHPEPGYYGDFYRFTYDGVKYLTRKFSHTEIQNVRGAFATVLNLFPFLSKKTHVFDWVDRLTGKSASKQTSGYAAFCIK